jgi:hypothetical protein
MSKSCVLFVVQVDPHGLRRFLKSSAVCGLRRGNSLTLAATLATMPNLSHKYMNYNENYQQTSLYGTTCVC